jgi:hypothetical protein
MRRLGVVVGSAVVLGAMLWPAVSPSELDSLPMSNYPMFARPRSQVTSFRSAVLIDAAGRERRLDPSEVSGTDQPMQAAMTLRRSIRDRTADALCGEIAVDLAVDGERAGTVQIVTERYDTIAWFRGDRDPLAREVHAECRVDR